MYVSIPGASALCCIVCAVPVCTSPAVLWGGDSTNVLCVYNCVFVCVCLCVFVCVCVHMHCIIKCTRHELNEPVDLLIVFRELPLFFRLICTTYLLFRSVAQSNHAVEHNTFVQW